MLFGYLSNVPYLATEKVEVPSFFSQVSSCLLGSCLIEADFSFLSSFFLFSLAIQSESVHTAFLCSERSIHHVTVYVNYVLRVGWKVVIAHCNVAMQDVCKTTSGSRVWDLLGGYCEGRAVSACRALSPL